MKVSFFALLYIILYASHPRSEHWQGHEPVQWQKMVDWRLYYSNSNNTAGLNFDSLATLPSKLLSKDTMSRFLEEAKLITPKTSPVWMGYYVLTCKTSTGTLMKVIVSHYGHFFYDPKSSQYYQLSEGIAKEWNRFLQAQWTQLESTIIPENS